MDICRKTKQRSVLALEMKIKTLQACLWTLREILKVVVWIIGSFGFVDF